MISWYHPAPSLDLSREVPPPVPKVPSPIGMVGIEFTDHTFRIGDGLFGKPKGGFVREGEATYKPPRIVHTVHDFNNRFKRLARSTGYSLLTIIHCLWLLCLPYKWVISAWFGLSHDQLHRAFSDLCMNAIRKALDIELHPNPYNWVLRGASDQACLILYRSRRATAGPKPGDPLKQCQSFMEPVPTNVTFPTTSYSKMGKALLKMRRVHFSSGYIQAFQSRKSGLYYKRDQGGYNRCMGDLRKVDHQFSFFKESDLVGKTLLEDLEPFEHRVNANELFRSAVNQRRQFLGQLNLCMGLLLNLDRPLLAFAIELQERGNKRRTPNIPEEFAQCAAKAIGSFGLKCLEMLFPVEFRKRGRVKMLFGDWYKSGDFKDSTSFIFFTAGRVAWDIILDKVPIPSEVRHVMKLAIRKLIGRHLIFSDSGVRELLRSKVFPRTQGEDPSLRRYRPWLRKPNSIERLSSRKTPWKQRLPLIPTQYIRGSEKGVINPPLEFKGTSLHHLQVELEMADYYVLDVEHVDTVRGILMSYGIANTALFILNAIPHWEMAALRKGHRFFCSGDDNASSFRSQGKGKNRMNRSYKQMQILERKKTKSGMRVHDREKAFESTRGFILTEDLYLETKGSKYLSMVPNFPIRSLFPAEPNGWDFVSVPMSIRQYVGNIQSTETVARITGLLFSRYRSQYGKMRSNGISVCGPSSLINWEPFDGLPYHESTVRGIYARPTSQTDYSQDCPLGDYIVANKSFGLWVDNNDPPYLSRRRGFDQIRSVLSTVPIQSPYDQGPPFSGGPRATVEDMVERIARCERSRVRTEIGPPSIVQDVKRYNLGPRPSSVVNPFDPDNWKSHVSLDMISDRKLLPTIRNDTFHTDVDSLVLGIPPSSGPLEAMSLDSLSACPRHMIVDVRNQFPTFEESEASKGGPNALYNTVCHMVKARWRNRRLDPTVYWAVLEQPGPRIIGFINQVEILVISRPSRHNLGADTEVVSLYRLLLQRGVEPAVLTSDRMILELTGRR